ncbi:MAG: MarR family transcriptional regulator [Chloroflexi bacterium]|nr:MarR family transcriptional regulator [Chloroflexota bacterium]
MDKAELIREILGFQHRLSRALKQHIPDVWMDLNLTIPQLKSLLFIAGQGVTNFSKLAAALRVTPSNVTGIVDRLVEQGLVTRQENPEDRRMQVLRVTEKGEAMVTNLRERAMGHLAEVLGRLTVEELASVSAGLKLLVRAAETIEGERPG